MVHCGLSELGHRVLRVFATGAAVTLFMLPNAWPLVPYLSPGAHAAAALAPILAAADRAMYKDKHEREPPKGRLVIKRL